VTSDDTPRPRARLRDLAWVFLRLGSTSFGGPAAHISLMEEEVVRRRRWLTRERFLDLLGAANLVPGPNSTELAIHVGHDQAGWRGLVVAGACFIVPAMLIVMAIGWAYARWGSLPETAALLYGVKPVIIAVIVQALWGLARTAIKTWQLGGLCALATAASALGANELIVLLAAGVVALTAQRIATRSARGAAAFAPLGRSGSARCSCSSSRSAPSSTVAATSSSRSFAPTSSSNTTGSPRRNSWMRSRLARSRRARCSRRRRSSATSSAAQRRR